MHTKKSEVGHINKTTFEMIALSKFKMKLEKSVFKLFVKYV